MAKKAKWKTKWSPGDLAILNDEQKAKLQAGKGKGITEEEFAAIAAAASGVPQPKELFPESEVGGPITPIAPTAQELKDVQTIMKIKDILEKGFKKALIDVGNVIIDGGYLSQPKSGDVWKEWEPKKTYRQLVQHPDFPMTVTGLWKAVTVARMMRFLDTVEGGVDTDHLSFSHLLLIATKVKGPDARKDQVKLIKELKNNPKSVAALEASFKPVRLTGSITPDEQKAFRYIENVSNQFSDELVNSLIDLDISKLIQYTGSNDEMDLLLHLDVYTSRLHKALDSILTIKQKLTPPEDAVPISKQETEKGNKDNDV